MNLRRPAIAVAALLAFGIALRIVLQLPLHRWANEGDCTIVGFGAWEILAGDLRVFIATGYREGALACYLAAAASWLVGPGRAALALETAAVAIAQMFVWWTALLELTGWKAGSAASARLLAFIVLPSPAVVYWTLYWPSGYSDVFLAATLVLWAGARWGRRGGRFNLFAFALAAGFAFWTSMLTLAVSIPMLVWLGAERGRELLAPRRMAALVAGGILGAAPWLLFNLRYGWPSLRSNWAVRPTSGVAAAADNASRLISEVLPALVAAMSAAGYTLNASTGQRLLGLVALALGGLAIAILARAALRPRSRETKGLAQYRSAIGLAVGIVATSAALFVFSAAGAMPGNVVRYLLAIDLVWPLLVALGWELAGSRAKAALSALAIVVLAGFASAVPWPWTAERAVLREALAVEHRMIERLEAESVEAVFGSFWEVYPLIFESGGRLHGSTIEPDFDFHRFAEHLPQGPCRWAFVGTAGRVAPVVGRAGWRGRIVPFADGRRLFLPDSALGESSSCQEVLARLRSARDEVSRAVK